MRVTLLRMPWEVICEDACNDLPSASSLRLVRHPIFRNIIAIQTHQLKKIVKSRIYLDVVYLT